MRYTYRYQNFFTPISKILNRIGNKRLRIHVDNHFIEHQIIRNWDNMIGNKIAPYTEPQYLHGKNLTIHTINPVWATELSYMKDVIIENINAFLGKKYVATLYIKVGEVSKPFNRYLHHNDLDTVQLNPQEQDQITSAVSCLDGELKDILSRVMIKSLKRRRLNHELNT